MQTKTLFILGAGASAPYKLPLGERLIYEIANTIEEFQNLPELAKDFLTHEQYYRSLPSILRRSRSATIDSFLRDSRHRNLLIAAMASTIWKYEDTALHSTQPFEDDWIAWLYHNKLERKPDNFSANNVLFLSFNYDRLPEALLATMMANLYDYPASYCLERVRSKVNGLDRFFHVHGSIGPALHPVDSLDGDGYHVRSFYEPTLIKNSSESSLATMFDPPDGNTQTEIDRRIMWADNIYLIGLGFHKEIVDRFRPLLPGYPDRKDNHSLHACGFGLSDAAARVATTSFYCGLDLSDSNTKSTQFLSSRIS